MKQHFAATGFVFNGENKILMIKHKKYGAWLPPGGHMEKDEIPDEAVLREIFEETGVRAKLISKPMEGIDDAHARALSSPFCILLENIKGQEPHSHIDLIYLCRALNEDYKKNEEEIHDIGWFSVEEIANLETFENVIKSAKKAFEAVKNLDTETAKASPNETKVIETERLILRRITLDDAEDMFYGWANDPRISEYMTWSPHADIEVTKQVISYWLKCMEEGSSPHNWCIVFKETGKAIGTIGVHEGSKRTRTGYAGYCISHAYWNKGIMTEALSAVCDYLFDETDYNRIEAVHDIENPSSGRVMEKVGMRYEGIKRQGCMNGNGKFVDVGCYAILKEDRRERK
jgi:ribosomal-protein-alanine N-acetyltransferase